MSDTIVETDSITKHYRIADRQIRVLDSVTLSIRQGEFVVVSGTSGSGKTTLLSILSGLDKPSSGTIHIAGRDITDLSEDSLAPIRNVLTGFVFQAFHLIPSLNALENVAFPAELNNDPQAFEKSESLLKRVGLWERRTNMISQLSGGEKQRVAICRALINRPKLVFADEPTGNLDSGNSTEIMKLLQQLHRELGMTMIMATHSQEIADQADRVLFLDDGRLVNQKSPVS